MIYLITNQTSLWDSNLYTKISVKESISKLKELDQIAVDTETTGLNFLVDKILILQIGNKEQQHVIDATSVDIVLYKEILESKFCLLQNAKFDIKMLFNHKIVLNEVYDTMLAEQILFNGLDYVKKDLNTLLQKYCKVQLDKSIRVNIKKEGLSDKVIKYSADDVKYLADIKNKQDIEAKKRGLFKAIQLDNKFVIVLSYMEYCGIYLDKDKWEKKCKKDDAYLQSCKKKLDDFIISNKKFDKYIDKQGDLFDPEVKTIINWNSEKQVIPIMHELGVDTKIKDKETGKIKNSIDKKVLGSQIKKHAFIKEYIEYKEAAKTVSTYGRVWYSYINKTTNRIHTNFNQLMHTGRLSSGQRENKKRGLQKLPNMQNVPGDFETRSCFTSMKGNKLIVADYTGQEQVILANKCMDPNILEFYDSEQSDMHSFVCKKIAESSDIFPKEIINLNLKEIKERFPKERQSSKSTGFTINYGGVGITIAKNLGVSKQEGDAIFEAYFKAFPQLGKYFNNQKKLPFYLGFIQFNEVSYRKYFIPYFSDFKNSLDMVDNKKIFAKKSTIEKNALNYPIQGTASDMTKLAAIYLYKYLKENGHLFEVFIPNIVHDEIHLESEDSLAEKLAKVLKGCMEKAGDKFCKRVPLKADPHIGTYWHH